MKDKIISILEEVNPNITIETKEHLVRSGMIDSFDISSIVVSLEELYGIEINGSDIIPDNFASVDSIVEMVKKYL